MSILLIGGSPSESSRSAALLDAVQARLVSRDALVDRLRIRDLAPQALLLADVGQRSIAQAIAQVEHARAIVVATPVYKAAYSGVLKVFLDLLPQTAFQGKTVLPLASGGSPHHMLALDYALRPVLQSLGAHHILPGVFATDAQIVRLPEGGYHLDEAIALRINAAVDLLPLRPGRRSALREATSGFEPVHFSRVRCSA